VTADVLLDDIVERSTRRYLVTKVLNVWEVSMGGSHNFIGNRTPDLPAVHSVTKAILYSIRTLQLFSQQTSSDWLHIVLRPPGLKLWTLQ
jgi:hypothetical protein